MPDPTPRKRTPLDLRSLARSYTRHTLEVLHGITINSTNDSARVSACAIILDRGWGKAEQPHTGQLDADIKITIRQIISGEPEPKTIEHKEDE